MPGSSQAGLCPVCYLVLLIPGLWLQDSGSGYFTGQTLPKTPPVLAHVLHFSFQGATGPLDCVGLSVLPDDMDQAPAL